MSIWSTLCDTPFALTWVDADGVSTRALVAGDGPDVVFTHGTSGHLEAFIRNVKPYVDAGFRVHLIDLLGHGYTGKPDHPYELPDYVDHVLAYCDAQSIDRAHFVGESLGGWVSAYIGADHGERALTLQLIAPGGTKANPEIMERLIRTTTAAVTDDDIALTRDRLRLLMADPDRDVSEELVKVRYEIYHRPEFQANVDNLLSLQQMERRQRNLLRPETMQRINVPTLIVWGRQNPFGEVPEAELMHENIPGSQLELLDDCGHWPQHEQADAYNEIALKFLAQATD
ncbi:alpha/beta fold hydrolase [soil metagenome]|jgi:2-hydroxy-6-oxonona-2,4-dienedioate hydrolase